MSAAVALLQLQTTNLTRLPRPLTGPRNDEEAKRCRNMQACFYIRGKQVMHLCNDIKG